LSEDEIGRAWRWDKILNEKSERRAPLRDLGVWKNIIKWVSEKKRERLDLID
jgi:hypothetical protein